MNKTIQLRSFHQDDLVFCQKASGFNTHASDRGKVGLVEILQESLGVPLFVVHRLDQGTSGALVFARSSEVAAELSALFESRQVNKTYLFLTAARSSEQSFVVSSLIEKNAGHFVSHLGHPASNARTSFKKIDNLPLGDLWEATPETGKPHQIRLHAAEMGIPVLGDNEHGGAPFARLCLHSQVLAFNWRGRALRFEADRPEWARPRVQADHVILLDAIQSRFQLYDLNGLESECLRWAHRESSRCQIDHYGEQIVVSWYAEEDPSPEDCQFFEELGVRFGRAIFIRKMQNKGRDPHAKTSWKIGSVQDRWMATENALRFELRLDSGQSPGLFLDQRENRFWIRQQARDQRVLNLFSYTGGFSVNAACGGAREVCTVDVSAKFNAWTEQNFRLNDLDPQDRRFEFWSQDVLLFLRGAHKRGRQWDLIICDPPSFGRSKDGVFQLQKQFPELLNLCLDVLSPGGKFLFSTNFERWTTEDLRAQVLRHSGSKAVQLTPVPLAGLDFERPGQEPLMKSIILAKV